MFNLFGKKKKEQPDKKPTYHDKLGILVVYRDFDHSEEALSQYFEEYPEEELWQYSSVGQSGPMSFDEAKAERIPLPIVFTYPLFVVYEPSDSKEIEPLFSSVEIEEVKRFIEKYEQSAK
ncbi:hypothetical protein [Gracilibacillus massiliensis]|uniref:hypothetical protein n=1 Tax=Gracilibacillus massiliensis TaxID=1564956 RepID=UPI00071C1EED|nr:hypothetical protein [Gracilibacillus massiliensis]